MTHLLDANVLIALGWPAHPHYHPANRWLPGRKFATCAQTQLAFLRVSTHPRLPYRATLADARATLRSILAKGRTRILGDGPRAPGPNAGSADTRGPK